MIVESFAAALGVLGIGVLFNVRGRNLIASCIGGGIGWLCYKICLFWGITNIPSLYISSIVISIFSEICARKFKTPVTVFLIGSLIPLVPGGAMYHTMYNAVTGDSQTTLDMTISTLGSAAILAFGIMTVSTIIKIIKYFKRKK